MRFSLGALLCALDGIHFLEEERTFRLFSSTCLLLFMGGLRGCLGTAAAPITIPKCWMGGFATKKELMMNVQ